MVRWNGQGPVQMAPPLAPPGRSRGGAWEHALLVISPVSLPLLSNPLQPQSCPRGPSCHRNCQTSILWSFSSWGPCPPRVHVSQGPPLPCSSPDVSLLFLTVPPWPLHASLLTVLTLPPAGVFPTSGKGWCRLGLLHLIVLQNALGGF